MTIPADVKDVARLYTHKEIPKSGDSYSNNGAGLAQLFHNQNKPAEF